jgi:hypothetical protein
LRLLGRATGWSGVALNAARLQAVDTLAFIRDCSAAEAVLALATVAGGILPAATAASDPVRAAALWWARFRAGNDWKTFDIAARLPDSKATAAERAQQGKVYGLRRTLLNANAALGEREKAALSLAGTEAGGLVLLQLASAGQLPVDVNERLTEAIFRNPSLAVRAMASQYFQRPSRNGQAFPPVADLMKRRGDAVRGKRCSPARRRAA